MTELEYKRTSALCLGCGTANPPHELWERKCLKCVGKELSAANMRLAAIYSWHPLSAQACPMCKYEDGVFQDYCEWHRENLTSESNSLRLQKELADERQKREQAEKSAAAMREALRPFVNEFNRKIAHSGRNSASRRAWNEKMPDGFPMAIRVTMGDCRRAVATDISDCSASNWVPADRFKEVVEALESALYLVTADLYFEQETYDRAKAALARAKEVGK